MPKTKKYLPFPLFLIIASVVGLGVWRFVKVYTPVAQPVGINEISSTGTVTLDASPAPTYSYLGDEVQLDINAHSGTSKVTAIQLELEFDPAKIQIKNFAPTSYLSNIIVAPLTSNSTGMLTATLGAPLNSGGVANWGTIGKLTLVPLVLGTYTINFSPNNLVSTVELSGNSLLSTTPITINVFNHGDLNKDRIINIFDYNQLVAHFGSPYTIFDYNHLVANYGKTSP